MMYLFEACLKAVWNLIERITINIKHSADNSITIDENMVNYHSSHFLNAEIWLNRLFNGKFEAQYLLYKNYIS